MAIKPEDAIAFTKELDDLMKRYGFAFPSATWIYERFDKQPDLIANTELLEKLGDDPKFNSHFTMHYGRREYGEV